MHFTFGMNDPFVAIDPTSLATITGGEGDGVPVPSEGGGGGDGGGSSGGGGVWQGVKNFGGGLGAGVVHGVNAKTEQVARWADPSSQATKAGFELGSMVGMRRMTK